MRVVDNLNVVFYSFCEINNVLTFFIMFITLKIVIFDIKGGKYG